MPITRLILVLLQLGLVINQLVAAPKYVGSASCAECHQAQMKLWRGSHHELAMQHADSKSVLGNFENSKFNYNNIRSTFFKKNDKFFVNTDGPDGKLTDYQIKYTFGVKPLQQYLIEFPNGRLQALGIAWDTRSKAQGGQRWYHLYPDQKITYQDRLHWSKPDQNWNYMCAECHSTNLKKNYNSNTNNYKTSWSEINVACEACHGPGATHVNWAKTKKSTITNKGLLVTLNERANVSWNINKKTGNAKRSHSRNTDIEIEICARCHSRRSVINDNYTPGQQFMDYYQPALLTEFLYHPDGQIKEEVYVYGSFIQSKMYHQGVTCSDCHNPHSTQLRVKGNGVCLQCHAAQKYNQTTHHFHKQGGKGSLCAECHMPQTVYMGVDGRHDHSIRIPRPDLSITLKTPNACNNCHKNKDGQWAAATMEKWYGKDWTPGWHFGETLYESQSGANNINQDLAAIAASPKLPVIVRATATDLLQFNPGPITSVVIKKLLRDDNPMIRLAALQTLDTVAVEHRLKSGFALLSDPVLAVRIEAARILSVVPNSILSKQQQSILEKTIKEYQQAQLINANRAESLINLGLLEIRLRQYDKAEQYYKKAIKLNPAFVNTYVNLADLYRVQQQENKAVQVLKQGLKISDNNADVHHALGLLYIRTKQNLEALQELKTAYELQKNNVRYGYVYAVALNSHQQPDRAIKTLTKIHKRHPNDQNTLIALVSFTKAMGKQKEALIFAKKLQILIPDDPELNKLIQSLKLNLQ